MKKSYLTTVPILNKVWEIKLLRIMKLSIVICLLWTSQVFAGSTYTQNTRLSLNLSNTTIRTVLQNIEEQTEFFFMYNGKFVDVDRVVSCLLYTSDAADEEDSVDLGGR